MGCETNCNDSGFDSYVSLDEKLMNMNYTLTDYKDRQALQRLEESLHKRIDRLTARLGLQPDGTYKDPYGENE
jgi:hypothetical protein